MSSISGVASAAFHIVEDAMPPKDERIGAPPTDRVPRIQIIGTYGFYLSGLLRATDNSADPKNPDHPLFLLAPKRPQIEKPVVLAGFQSPPNPNNYDPTKPLPQEAINSGYYPYALVGLYAFKPDFTIEGRHVISIGGNTDATPHGAKGTYTVDPHTGLDGTILITDQVNKESALLYFVCAKEHFQKLYIMDASAKPGTDTNKGRVSTSTGVMRRISGDVLNL